jgi:hypothetical protein
MLHQGFDRLAPLMPQGPLTPDDAWGLTEAERDEYRALLTAHDNDDIFAPHSFRGTVVFARNGTGTNSGGLRTNRSRRCYDGQSVPGF